MKRDFAADYILANFEPSDRLAVVLVDKWTGSATQRITTAEKIAASDFQAWLHYENAKGRNVYLSMNALKPEAQSRTKNDVGLIRHIYLDFDEDKAAVGRLIESHELPAPHYIVSTSRDKRHLIWRVEEFNKEAAEHLQKHLARQWGADPAATDCARVLRLPGFYNQKYGVPYWVRPEPGGTDLYPAIYRPEDFPEFSHARPISGARKPVDGNRLRPRGALSQSEYDWAYAKRALSRGESEDAVIKAIADYRRNDKPNPVRYATYTVQKAAMDVAQERGNDIV